MKFLRWLHTAYGFSLFVILFLVLFPLFLIPVVFPKQHRLVGVLNRWWAYIFFPLIALPYRVLYEKPLDPKQQYIFTPNHFSYFDIAAMGLNKHNTIFVGKNDMEKIPLFGYMYRKLHITVDRGSLKSRYNTIHRSMQAVDEGKSLVIFPEGGIITQREPVLGRFKDGAFRIAIEKQIPIVPVTILHNWIILPADQFLFHWHPLTLVFHEPIETETLTLQDIDQLKEKVFNIIDEELTKHR